MDRGIKLTENIERERKLREGNCERKNIGREKIERGEHLRRYHVRNKGRLCFALDIHRVLAR